MNHCYMSQQVQLLTQGKSNEKVPVMYNENNQPYTLPLMGLRPPYFTNPQYTPYYPIL